LVSSAFQHRREPALPTRVRNGSRIHPFGVRPRGGRAKASFTPVDEEHAIEYDKEDPEIRRLFEAALAMKGLKTDMRP